MAFIPFILFIAVWIIVYKQFINKQKGKLISHLLGFSISFLVFIISIIIIAPQTNNQQNSMKEEIINEHKETIIIKKEPLINTSKIKSESAEYAFASFINSWNNKDYKEMNNFTQLRWKEKEKNPEEFLKNFYDLKNLQSAKIVKIEKSGTAAYKITANIVYTINLLEEKKINVFITGMIINEDNTWGVNPISTIKEDDKLIN
jgi:hypothetical protein